MLNTVGLNGVNNTKKTLLDKKQATAYQPTYFASQLKADTISFSRPTNNVIAFGRRGKEATVVTFTGLKDPLKDQKPAIQMKVRGVMAHQHCESAKFPAQDYNVNTLAGEKVVDAATGKEVTPPKRGRGSSGPQGPVQPKLVVKDDTLPRWRDGQQVFFKLNNHPKLGPQILLSAPGIGSLGRVHDEVAEVIMPLLFDKKEQRVPGFKFELSNMVAGTTKGAETIGLRVNLIYDGDNAELKEASKVAFDTILNDPMCADKVLLHQDKTSPEEVLKTILDYEKKANGPEAAKEMQDVISNIVKEIKDPANKRILLVGHCKPDGDTLGCVLGLRNAIALMDDGRTVDCAVDDKIPGLFRHKMPGITDVMKRPVNPERVQQLKDQVALLEAKEQTPKIAEQMKMLKEEIEIMQDKSKLLDPQAKYDLVITMDIPTPKRFTDKFKQYFDSANKTIYIDHHPHRLDEWNEAAPKTGLDIEKIHENKLAWIADGVPAATQLIGVLGNKLLPGLSDIADGTKKASDVFTKPGQMDNLKAYVASLITGASTDTGSYTRTANLLPEHMKNPDTGEVVPVQQRPNFLPEGMGKWLMSVTEGAIDKKWLREEISWDLSEKKLSDLDTSARDIMLTHAVNGRSVEEDLSLGFIEVSYDQMNEVWQAQREVEPDTTLLDIQNAFKYSETLGVLRSDPALSGDNQEDGPPVSDPDADLKTRSVENYAGSYDTDRIAILICQDKKAGELDEKLTFAEQNGLRLSLRSMEGSTHAEMIATLFGGGGHGGAAGGRVDLPGVELDTPLCVKIAGKTETDYSKVLATLKNNYEIQHKHKATKEDKARIVDIHIEKDPGGVRTTEIIKNLVTEIRANQETSANKEEAVVETRNPNKRERADKQTRRRDRNNEREVAQNGHGKSKKGKRKKHVSFLGAIQNVINQKVS